MKNNTDETKSSLQKALQQIPQDHTLSEVRYHIRAAIEKIESVEKRRNRREVNLERRELAKIQNNSNGFDPFRAIYAIDEEIAKEKSKIKDIQKRRTQLNDKDGDEIQTVFN